MANKITVLSQLKACAEAARLFTSGLIVNLAETVSDALTELEQKKADKVEDKGTGKIYTLSMENGLIYLDDGED